jgi:hypothetical protein
MSDSNTVLRFLRQVFRVAEANDDRGEGRVLAHEEFVLLLEKERHKSDRAQLPFAILTLPLRRDGGEARVIREASAFLRQHMRLVDEIGMLDDSTLAIYMFGTSAEGAYGFIHRLAELEDAPGWLCEMVVHVYPDRYESIQKLHGTRRRKERIELELTATISSVGLANGNGGRTLVTRDVSSKGAFLLTDTPLEEGSEVELEIMLPVRTLAAIQGEQIAIRAKGHILRTERHGMAVEFTTPCTIESKELTLH